MRPRFTLLYCLLVLVWYNGYAQSRTEFIENKGQWASWFKYKATTPGGEVYLENDGLRYLLCDPSNVPKMDSFHHGLMTDNPIMRFHVYKVTFEGANQPQIEGQRAQKNYYNYYLGNDSSHWKTGIHPYLAIDYNNLYNGITMHITSGSGALEYEFFVQPAADPTQVKMNFDGPDDMSVKNGDLVINTSVGKVMEMKPYAYQYINDNKVEVACNYHLKKNKVTFSFPQDYDHSKLLIIDPIVFWCSFTGSTADNWGFTATYDNAGDFYLGGLVNALTPAAGGFGGSYPVTPGAYQSTFGGGQGNTAIEYGADIGIMKLSPDGTSRIYATYLGGSNNERPHSLIVDADDNLIIAGRTHSHDFPVTAGAYQTTNAGGWDIIVSKLNATGTALLASTYMGGNADDGMNFDSTEVGYGHLKYNYGDDARSEVQIDNAGNIYVAGCTESANFPVTPGTALSATFGGGLQDGVVFKLNSTLSTLLWGTYIGGNGDDAGYVLAFNTSQSSLYVAGGTNSHNFPVTPATWQTTYQGDSADGFILKFKNSPPYTLQKGTFVGTAHYDQVYGIQVDESDNVYVMGQSLGGTFPVTASVYTNPNSSQFVMKTDSNLSADLISTVYGSGDPLHTNISPVAFLVDTCNNIYISGWGGNIMGASAPGLAHSGTTTGMPTTPDGFQLTTDGYDFYFIVLGPGMTTLRYATFYGRDAPGGFGEHVDGGTSRFSKQGIIYQAICANCGGTSSGAPPFPTTPGVVGPTDLSHNCNEAGLKIAFNIGPVTASVTAGPSTSGCAPLTVNFTNTSINGLTYLWNFGDGSPTVTSYSTSHTFTGAGTYTVTLSAANSNACFRTADTARLLIVVDSNSITPAFTDSIINNCGPYTVSFVNNSISHVVTDTTSYAWYFGDGTSFSGTTPPVHNYPDTGAYTIVFVMANAGACKTPDTLIQTINISNLRVSANFTAPDSICLGQGITPLFSGINAASTSWTFGDGQSSTATTPTHYFDSLGTFTITVIAKNPAACNGADTFKQIITVLSVPTANFSFTPVFPQPNIPTTFTNLSFNAIRYLWDFGDDSGSTETNPVHQYDKTGNYKVCLTAYNKTNCPAVACKQVPAEVQPLIGLPSAFSPNGDGENDILYVRGAAIQTLDLKIFNRWGQLVFETTSKEKGWDGSFNGQPCPIDAYAYVLKATFIDGTGKIMKGNITLLR